MKAVESQTLKTVGFEGLSQTTEDILYHLYPKCDKIDHSITNGEDFWHQFYQSYVITESALSPYAGETAREVVDRMLEKAVGEKCTDVHLTPRAENFLIRFRRDGILMDGAHLDRDLAQRCTNRFKVLGGMHLAQQQTPQDGRFSANILGAPIDCRLSTHPTMWGEKIVVRILDKKHAFVPLEQLGFSPFIQVILDYLLSQPAGLFIVTGPTGAGKTTTLYAILERMNHPSVNIVTLESPIEYRLPGITQTEAERHHITYTQGLRSLLRQDPDIILIGEIRDDETAKMAIRAAMTGHKVLTTFHTQDVFGVIPRLLDLNIERSLIAEHLLGILSQRLIRKKCVVCQGKGCDACYHVGLNGRTAVGEILPIDHSIKRAILEKKDIETMRCIAQKNGYIPLEETARHMALQGMTTDAEVARILGPMLDVAS